MDILINKHAYVILPYAKHVTLMELIVISVSLDTKKKQQIALLIVFLLLVHLAKITVKLVMML